MEKLGNDRDGRLDTIGLSRTGGRRLCAVILLGRGREGSLILKSNSFARFYTIQITPASHATHVTR